MKVKGTENAAAHSLAVQRGENDSSVTEKAVSEMKERSFSPGKWSKEELFLLILSLYNPHVPILNCSFGRTRHQNFNALCG